MVDEVHAALAHARGGYEGHGKERPPFSLSPMVKVEGTSEAGRERKAAVRRGLPPLSLPWLGGGIIRGGEGTEGRGEERPPSFLSYGWHGEAIRGGEGAKGAEG